MQPVLTGPVAGGSSIRKGGATATAVRSKSVQLGPVSGLFPVHATGPLNTKLHTQLGWEEFLGLVGSHKSVAFELDAEIKLVGDFACCTQTARNTGEIAKAIAEEVWKVAGYRFM